jgi:hypothetical protein
MILDKIGGRKVLVSLVLLTVGVTVDMVSPNGISANLLDLLKYIGGGYLVGNGLAHITGAVIASKASQDSPGDVPSVIETSTGYSPENDILELKAQNGKLLEAVGTCQQALQFLVQKVSGQ